VCGERGTAHVKETLDTTPNAVARRSGEADHVPIRGTAALAS